jgi:hypothetical protein
VTVESAGKVHAVNGRLGRDPIVDVGATEYERSLDFPARESAAADWYGRAAHSFS